MILPLSPALLFSCGLVLIISWGWMMADWLWMRPKKLERILRLQGLSGNPYRFLFGDMRESSLMSKEAKSRPIALSDDPKPRFLPFVHHSVEKFGKDSFTWLGPTPRVNVTSPQLLKDIFLRIGEFQKSSPPPLVKLLSEGLASLDGDKWAMHRKIINPAFHIEKLKLMLPAFHSSIDEMVCGWEKLASAGEGYCTIDVWPELQNLTRDVISRTAFGSSFQEGRRIFELQNELVELVLETIQTIFIPGWRFVPTKKNQRMKSIDREVQMLLRGMIQRRENAMKAGEAPSDDLLGLLLESNMEEIQQQDSKNKKMGMGMGMSICDVIEECKLFYFAGQETTSVLLAWTMVLLGAYPEWQERAREEVLKLFGSSKPDFDQLNQLKIVTMILYEVIRLYPPVTSLTREVYKETKLGSLTLPAGVQLTLPVALVHRDPELWGEDAEEFKPERFREGISKATQNQVTYFPFAWGPRICIGQNFAMIEAKMSLAMILQRFTFELSPTYAHAPRTVITLHPQHGVQVVLRYREKSFAIIGIKVNAAGLYVNPSIVPELSAWKGKSKDEIQDDKSLFDTILRAPLKKSLQIVLVRDIDGKTFWDALDDAISPRITAPTPTDESALSTFRGIFEGCPLKKGTFIFLTWLDSSKMLVSISRDGWPTIVDVELGSDNVASSLFDVFFGASPVSPSLKMSVACRLASVLK